VRGGKPGEKGSGNSVYNSISRDFQSRIDLLPVHWKAVKGKRPVLRENDFENQPKHSF